MDESQQPTVTLESTPREPTTGRVRRILPWAIAAVAVLVAAFTVGVLVVNESSEPRPVAQLAAQTNPTPGIIPVDSETVLEWDLGNADFVSYGSYGEAEIWSTTTPQERQCLTVIVEGDTWMFRCTAPSVDTVADIDIDADMVPPAPSGEPTSNIRFVLHEDAVDVYLAPNPAGGFY